MAGGKGYKKTLIFSHSALVLLPGHSLAYLGFFVSDQLAADIHGHAVNRSGELVAR